MRRIGIPAGVVAAGVATMLLAGCGSTGDAESGGTPSDGVPSDGAPSDGADSTVPDAPQAVGYASVDPGTPVRVDEPAGVLLGDPDAPVTVDAYEDFLCPACAQFEKLYGTDVAEAVSDGSLAVRYRMLNFLDPASSSGDYSTRASAAALCVAGTGDGELYAKFHSALYQPQVQPVENGSSDLSDVQLADVAKQVGVADGTARCISDGAGAGDAGGRAQQSTQRLGRVSDGRVSTPTIMDGDEKIDINDEGWLDRLTEQ